MNNFLEFIVSLDGYKEQNKAWMNIRNKMKSGFSARMKLKTDPDKVTDVNNWDTVSHGDCILWLNEHFPGWGFDEKTFYKEGEEGNEVIICDGQLKIIDNLVSRSIPGTGRSQIKYRKSDGLSVDFGHNYKSAASDAIKKAASLVGFAPDIYLLDGRPPYSTIQKLEDMLKSEYLTEEQKEMYQENIDGVTKDRVDSLFDFLTEQILNGIEDNKEKE